MLTAEHARVRRTKNELRVVALSADARVEASSLAASLLQIAVAGVGASRGELEEAWDEVPVGPSGKRLRDGILKLLVDACEFEAPDFDAAAALRREVFVAATAARAAGAFDRTALLARAGEAQELSADEVEQRLYADLKDAHPLRAVGYRSSEAIVRAYEAGQAAAVLLRATRVVVEVSCASPSSYRALFRALKFHRLLFSAESLDEGGYRLTIDGPLSLFQSTKKYGLSLALMLPHVAACERWSLVADVAWGPSQEPLIFRAKGEGDEGVDAPSLPAEVDALKRAITRANLGWKAEASQKLLVVEGRGVVVPDLRLTRADGVKVYLEALGFFRRETVFQRLDLVAAGLGERVIFALSDKLRVSEEAVDADLPAQLYVYKNAMSARAVVERAESLAAQTPIKRQRQRA